MSAIENNRSGNRVLTRRDFLKLGSLSLGSFALRPFKRLFQLPSFPESVRLGRVNVGKVEIRQRPDTDSPAGEVLYEDAVVPWIKEIVGRNIYRMNQRWVETSGGYIWAPYLQPVKNQPNLVLDTLPDSSLGPGMWVEVTVPYVDLVLDNPPARSPGFRDRIEFGMPLRLYYSQITWVDRVKTGSQGQVWYRVNEPYGSYGDILWGAAEAFRPLSAEEIAPLSPEVEEKRVKVDVIRQALSCFEGNREVYYARVSTGALWDINGSRVDAWATPLGNFPIWRKLLSLHMSGGTTGGGWDLPGVGWVSLFVGSGVAVHSTFWHNNWGEPMSRGCVNATPEDSRWIFRWTLPTVGLDPGDVSAQWPGGTKVEVVEE